MNEKPSSRKRHRWSIEPGDLVRISSGRAFGPSSRPDNMIGMVLTVYTANVYEGTSAEVLFPEEKMLIETRFLIRIDPDSDISAIS